MWRPSKKTKITTNKTSHLLIRASCENDEDYKYSEMIRKQSKEIVLINLSECTEGALPFSL
jgi:hypothetical protein